MPLVLPARPLFLGTQDSKDSMLQCVFHRNFGSVRIFNPMFSTSEFKETTRNVQRDLCAGIFILALFETIKKEVAVCYTVEIKF